MNGYSLFLIFKKKKSKAEHWIKILNYTVTNKGKKNK